MSILLFAFRRLVWSVVTVAGVIAVTFAISHLIPADPAALVAGERATPEQIESIRQRYGFDRPLIVQLAAYYRQLALGDLGQSLYTSRDIAEDLLGRVPATVELTLVALAVSVGLGIPIGVLSALRRNSAIDHAVRLVTVSGLAIASFWFAIILQLVFAMRLGWSPLGGRIDGFPPPSVTTLYLLDTLVAGDLEGFANAFDHIVLPAATLAFPALATIVRFTRAGMLDAMNRPFVEYERAMGLPGWLITWKYVLRNAMTSTVTQIGLLSGVLLGGSVVIEMIFDWPGLGAYAVNSIVMSDYNAVLGVTLWVSVVYIAINTLVDIAQRAIDPRQSTA